MPTSELEPRGSIAGIILSAGASRRMGRPKALLDYRGETFIQRLVRILSGACDPVIVALGHGAENLRPHVPSPAHVVVNPDPDRGQLSSLQIALRAVPEETAGVLFTLVDCPAVHESTVAEVQRAFLNRPSGCRIVIPRYTSETGQPKRGHPVCIARELIGDFLALPPTAETRAVVNARADGILYLNVDDPGVLTDTDDPAAYARLTGKTLEPVR